MFSNLFGSKQQKTPKAREVELPSQAWVSVDELISLKARTSGLSLDSVSPAKASMAGAMRSRFRGRGMDFQESRGYQPGDDVRNMDWRVTARSGHAHVKVFTEERERPLVFLMDLRPSMFFASKGEFKSVQSCKAAAFLAWAGVEKGDRVGALMFNGVHHELSPKGGTKGALRLIRNLVEQSNPATAWSRQEHEGTQFSEALTRLRRVVRPGSLVFVLSDFSGMDEEAERQLIRLREHNDIVGIRFIDRLEQQPLPGGVYGVSNGQTHRVLDLSSKSARTKYLKSVADRQNRQNQRLKRCGVPVIDQYTDQGVVENIRDAMAPMSGRSAKHRGRR